MNRLIDVIEKEQQKNDAKAFSVGDSVRVHTRVVEGDKERIQIFEGDIIALHNNGASSTFTVRKIAAGAIAVERIFPLHAPFIEEIKFIRKGKVRRAKLYYMRHRIGKASRVAEKVLSRQQKEQKGS